jgi:hypothetical protein
MILFNYIYYIILYYINFIYLFIYLSIVVAKFCNLENFFLTKWKKHTQFCDFQGFFAIFENKSK